MELNPRMGKTSISLYTYVFETQVEVNPLPVWATCVFPHPTQPHNQPFRLTHLDISGINGWIPVEKFQPITAMLHNLSISPTTAVINSGQVNLVPVPTPVDDLAAFEDKAMSNDEYKKYVASELKKHPAIPKEIPVQETIGKSHLGLMLPQPPYASGHPAIPLLNQYAADGCPVDCGPDWAKEHILLMLARGPHQSAKVKMAALQLRAETIDKTKQGYARVVKWRDLKNNIPKKLKISPAAMIPHKSKPFRCILDLSFKLKHKGKIYSSVNEMTTPQAKPQAMVQLGNVIHRIIHRMVQHFNPHHPFKFAKLDIKDGFWRMAVSDEEAWNFCYILPAEKPVKNIDDTEIVVPNSLQMGWCESPPFFCSGSETARDIIAAILSKTLPPHKFEECMMEGSIQCPSISPQLILTLIEVYVDDFIGVTNDLRFEALTQLSRAMLHGIHSIFPPPSITGHCGHDPISEAKLEKGEGTWDYKKEILGWCFDGEAHTISLPIKKSKDIAKLISNTLKKRCITLNKFQQLAGKLQHASFGIPGGRSLFTQIDMIIKKQDEFVVLTPWLKETLVDWRFLVFAVAKRPTSIFQLVSRPPHYISYTDACGRGAGGVWCSGTSSLTPFLWQVEWPADIQANLVTSSNPKGTITINDLELAGILLGLIALEGQNIPLRHIHLATFCDNISAVVWSYKMRNSVSIIAGHILRAIGMHIHALSASSLIPHHIAGELNIMADVISRAFKKGKFFAASTSLPNYFNTSFPLVQNALWREYHIPTAQVSSVIASLRGKRLPLESLLARTQNDKNIGAIGPHTLEPRAPTLISTQPQYLPSSVILSQQHLLLGSGQVDTDGEIKSALEGSRMPSRQSARPLNWLDNRVPSTGVTKHTSSS